MSKVLRTVLISAYGFLFVQYLRISMTVSKDIIELEYIVRPKKALKKILHELKNNHKARLRFTYATPNRLPTDLKYILKWTQTFSHTSSVFRNGQDAFIENNCAHYNCYLTNDKSLLDTTYFDAILFDVQNLWDHPPNIRAVHQKYVFTASESASNFPVCSPFYDTFFNLTWTYKINSDVRWSYIEIKDKADNFIGPKIDMHWINPMLPTSENIIRRLVQKKKAVAWFVSHCIAKSGREIIAQNLKNELAKYNLNLDTYGFCGELSCTKDRIEECLEMLEQDYFFYLAFENYLSEDYVTEELLYPLRYLTVPVVYGGANYSRFLPPGSYINAGDVNVTEIAFLIKKSIQNPDEYYKYFRWHNHYRYKEAPKVADVCEICKVLNDPAKEHSVVKNFRKWWNPDHEVCMDGVKETKEAESEMHSKEFI